MLFAQEKLFKLQSVIFDHLKLKLFMQSAEDVLRNVDPFFEHRLTSQGADLRGQGAVIHYADEDGYLLKSCKYFLNKKRAIKLINSPHYYIPFPI